MKIEFKSQRTVIVLILIILALIGYSVWSSMKHFQNSKTISQQNTELANLRKIAQTDGGILLQEAKKDTIMLPGDKVPYPVYHTQYIDKPTVDKETMKKVAVSDSTIRNLVTALNLKTKEIDKVTTLYTSTKAENLQLKQNDNKTYVYRDKFIYIEQDSNRLVKNLDIKGGLSLTDYWKRKNLFASRDYYTSTLTESPYLKVDSISKVGKKQRETVFKLYVDNMYYNNFNMNGGFMTNTLNAEINGAGTFTWIFGSGIKTNMVNVETIFVSGIRINLWRIKK